jgi:hypothetical protein
MTKSLLNYTCSVGMLLCALTPSFSQVPGNPRLEKANRPKLLPDKAGSKLSPDLRTLVSKAKTGDVTTFAKPTPGKIKSGIESLLQIYDGKVVIDATVDGDQTEARLQLQKAGAKITGSFGKVISALIPIEALPQLETSTQLRFIKPSYKPRHQNQPLANIAAIKKNVFQPAPAQTVYSQGDTAQGSYLARKKYKADGKGVKVGILSDSYDNLSGAETGVLNGELPGSKNPFNYKKPVKVLADLDSGGIDEGRAMAEIVHDVAPGAEIAFNTAFLGQAAFAQGIVDLAKIGCQVIADDIYYSDEPYFQDGIIAQAIDKVVKNGATYFSAAGNSSTRSYEMNYKPSTFEPLGPGWGTAHNFAAPGAVPIYYQPVFVPVGGLFTVGLQWDDPFFSAGGMGAESDVDLFIFDETGEVIAWSFQDNLASGDPVEFTGFYNNSTSNTFYISILKYTGPNPSRLKYIMYDQGSFYSGVPIPGQFAPSVVGHPNSAGAIATAASWYKATPAYGVDIPLVESFSSLGGTMIYFDKDGIRIPAIQRKKPDITAPDGGNTSFFYSDEPGDSDAFPNFFGTSAAAPHAAAAAALMIDAQKLNTLTPAQIRGIMTSQTYDMDNRYTPGFDKGFDYNTGTGLLRADQSVGEVKFPNLYIKNLELVALCSDDPGKTRNWKIINPNPFEVKVHWFLTGFGQDNKTSVQPGDTYFSTQTGYYRNRPVPNIVILDWEDNFGFTRFDLASAMTNECKNDVAVTQVLSAGDKAVLVKEKPVKPEIADVFPNPGRSQFKLYLSLNNPAKADITLYTESGKMLYRNNVPGSGIYDIDASTYKPGLYLMKIKQGSFTKTIKLIKQ